MLADIHAHYDDQKFENDRNEIIQAVKQSGVDLVVNSGASVESSAASVELAEKYDFFYASVGVHPHEAKTTPDNTIDILAEMQKNKKTVAIGEIGFDFYGGFSDREAQSSWFKKQMDLAAETGYPVIIHNRSAHGECLEMVKKYKGAVKGVFHCFSGSAEMACELIKVGYMMSFGGVATFTNAKSCAQVLKELPLEYILLETDCPYLAPHPLRGKRNDSRNLYLIADRIAVIKNVTADKIISQTGENAKRLFDF